MKQFTKLGLGVPLLLLAVTALAFGAFMNETGPKVGESAPKFETQTLAGETLKLEDLKGKLVLVDFWATWCPPCRMEIPHIRDAYEKYHDKGLVIVSVSVGEKADKVKAFAQENKMVWTHIADTKGVIADKYEVESIPAPYLIDSTGKIVAKGFALLQGRLEEAIETNLKNLPRDPEQETGDKA